MVVNLMYYRCFPPIVNRNLFKKKPCILFLNPLCYRGTMSDISPSLDNYAHPDRMKVFKIEKQKKEPSILFKGNEILSKELIKAIFFQALFEKSDHLLKLFIQIWEIDILAHLKKLKSLLETLMEKDISQNYLFAQSLSEEWHALLCFLDIKKRRRKKSIYFQQLQTFIEQVHQYPKKADLSLGYYLTKFTGKKWLPFPFIKILFELHEDFEKNHQASLLSHWVTTLSHLIDNKIETNL